MFRKVDSKANFPQLEEGILHFWKEHDIFSKSIKEREGAPHYTFYEGPPTANGSPGVHHALSRLFKDVICRYKTMKGYHVPRKAGWDTHGLPVELEVENSLGLTNKAQIEEYGIARFNQDCRESVFHYIGEWEKMTERIGCWLDMEHPYITLDNSYIESSWWAIKRLWDRGLIYQGYKVTPHCPRCGTSLSSHEVSLGYKDDAEDPSVYIKFKVPTESCQLRAINCQLHLDPSLPTYLLAWTTTPWTLPGNTALAVAPEAEYSVMGGGQDYLILATVLVKRIELEGYKQIGIISGEALMHLEYEPLFNPHNFAVQRLNLPSLAMQEARENLTYPVIGADFVSLEEGTGIVHMAPAFGEVDFNSGMDNGLDFVQPVDLGGRMTGSYPFAGKFVKDADPLILDDLSSRGLLYRSERIIHTYPFCWRCESPLLYYAKRAWYIKTTAVKDRLISGNAEINWYPDYIKYGRFGDWLENNVDWAFSRERYWGTPLNIWKCESCGNYDCVGSIAELKAKPGLAVSCQLTADSFDLHRPYVDEITFACPKCGGEMRRVPEVIDCWFDSGAMPFAQWHYPFENKNGFEENFPADFICEAVDQTRGWFYSLHAISSLLFAQPCFRNVLCLGHVVDAQGEKMSKSKDNVVDPWTVVNSCSADALRWYMLTSASGEDNHRFSVQMVTETMRKFLLTLWNTYSFFTLYANIDRFVPQSSCHCEEQSDEAISSSLLDNWIISELNRLIAEVTKALDCYNPTLAARQIENFVDNLSNWYVRRSRRRFWKSENDADKLAAYTTLYQCLVTLSRLLAPLAPFTAEEIYQNLVRSVEPEAKESVHLTDFPIADMAKIDDKLAANVELTMKISSLGRAARAKAGIKVRQPLAKAAVKAGSKAEKEALRRSATEIMEEINVKEIEFSTEGPFSDMPGYSVADDSKYWVAISTELTPELVAEGVSREIVRRLQDMRRTANFDVADHIVTYYQAEEPVRRAMIDFASYIKQETLSQELINELPPKEAYIEKHRISGRDVLLAVKKQLKF